MSRAGGSRKVPVRYAEPREDSALLTAAIRAHKKGQLTVALESYRLRLSEAPSCLDAWMNLGALQAQTGRANEAGEAFRKAAVLAPRNARVFRDIGLGLWTIGRLREATVAFEKSVQCDPSLVGSWLHLARTRLDVTERRLAIAAASKASTLRPLDPSAHFLFARCVFQQLNPARTLSALELAQRCPKPYPEASVFHWLVASCCVAEPLSSQVSEEGLRSLVGTHPQLEYLVDAALYIQRNMPKVRLFSGARETLHFAVSRAEEKGSVVELGVFHGVSLRWLAEWRPGDVHGFDSFLGLPSSWDPVPEGRFTTAGRTPEGIDATYWIGAFEDQLPKFVAQHPEFIALLHIDSDLYESANCGLTQLAPLLRAGGIIVFDEYLGHRSWRQDEYRAFQEAVQRNGWRYEYLAVNPFTGQAVIRLLARR